MVNFLCAEKSLTRMDAYMLCSVACDLRIHEAVSDIHHTKLRRTLTTISVGRHPELRRALPLPLTMSPSTDALIGRHDAPLVHLRKQ